MAILREYEVRRASDNVLVRDVDEEGVSGLSQMEWRGLLSSLT